MTDCMDTTFDQLAFDIQSTYLSFEERRWINEQRRLHNLDKIVQSLGDLQKKIRDSHHYLNRFVSSLLPTVSSSTPVPKVAFNGLKLLYYPSASSGTVDTSIDHFRLHYQQLFQMTFNDLTSNNNYRLFIILLEGLIFASSQTAEEYSASVVHEMRKCLTSFESFIRTRTSTIQKIIEILSLSSLPFYSCVFSIQQKNIGVLFQMLPKIRYCRNVATVCNSILVLDDYANYTISPEELRYVDYLSHMRTKRHQDPPLQQTVNPTFTFGTGGPASIRTYPFASVPDMFHSLPIEYPYDEKMVYGEKYPSFWKGTKHTDENNTVLFETVSLEPNTPEFTFVQRLFNKTVSENQTKIAVIERVQNPYLWGKFCAHRSQMRCKNGKDNVNENWLFHGTRSDNHHQIISDGFNRSYCRDTVLYGRGVYFARYASYSCLYSDRKDLSFLFLCRVLVGRHTVGTNDIHTAPCINLPDGQKVQMDSTTNQQDLYTIVCTFHDNQNYPEYIIAYTDETSKR